MKVKLLVLLIMALVFSSCGGKKTGETVKPTETMVTTPAVDYKMMIIAKLSVKPEKVKDFIEVAKGMTEMSNKEAGCSFYKLYQDPFDNSKFVFVEEYKNQTAVDSHFATEYFKAFGSKIGDLVAAPAEIKIVSVANEVIK